MRRCAGWRARLIFGRTAATMRPECCARSSSTRTCGCPSCTPSSSISRCWKSIGPAGLEIANGMTSEAAERQLAALGYEGPQTALNHMSALVNQSGRRGRVQSVLLPRLLNWMSYTPDPDAGLLAYRRLSEALASESWYLATLRDKPAVARRLMHVLGTSAYVPDLLMRAPRVIQDYGDGPGGPKLLETDPAVVARALIASAARHADPVRAIAGARTLRRRELARIGSADLLGMLEVTGRVQGADVGVGGCAAGRSGRADPGQPPRRRQSAGGHRGHRHGQAGWRRTGLRVRCRRDVRLRTG